MKPSLIPLTAALVMTALATVPPAAAGPHDRGLHKKPPPRVLHRAPPARWYPTLPRRATPAVVAGITYFILDGVFHKRSRDGFVVVEAPVGAVLKVPPPGYRVVVLGPRTYYVAHGTWYILDEDRNGYVVVERPIEEPQEEKAVANGDEGKLYVYPKGGQSDEQLARDRYECHQWAVKESGFDPSLDDASNGQGGDYRRAVSACLEAREYTVR